MGPCSRPVGGRPLLVLALTLALLASAMPRAGAAEALPAGVFARVEGQDIDGKEYLAVLRVKAKQKFYHGQAPEAELAAFRRQVGEALIRNVLLAREAKRRALPADEQAVERQLAALEQRYAGNPQWKAHRATLRSQVGERLRRNSRIAALEAQVRHVPPPSEAQLRAYYERHPDKFTTPERVRVSMILLRVPAAAPAEAWEQARRRIDAIAAELRAGASFDALARQHSQDASADAGGDLGYLHHDMVGGGAQKALDALQPGEVSAPVQLLEGYALLRLRAREPARLNPLAAVRERAAALWRRQAEERAWRTFADGLRAAAHVQVNEHYYRTRAAAAAQR